MSRIIATLLALSCGLMIGCATFDHPLSPIKEAHIDEEAFGSWYFSKKDDEGRPMQTFVHIGLPRDSMLNRNQGEYANFDPRESGKENSAIQLDNLMRVTTTQIDVEGRIQSGSFLAYPTKIDKYYYANVPVFQDGKVVHNKILKYEVEGDQLTTWMFPSDEAINSLIESGQLHAGEKKHRVNDDSETLRKVFVEHDAELFPPDKKVTFHRIQLWEK